MFTDPVNDKFSDEKKTYQSKLEESSTLYLDTDIQFKINWS